MNELPLEEMQKMGQNQDEFMTFKSEKVINVQNNNNQINNNQNENEFREDLNTNNQHQPIFKTNQNLKDLEKNNNNYANELNRNMNNNFVNNENYDNYAVKIINNNSPNYYNNNINYDEYDAKNDEIKNSNIHEIIVGNRRIERFDGAECNNNIKIDRPKQNINNQFFNNEQEIPQNNIQDLEFLNTFNSNKQNKNDEMCFNNINQINQNLQQNENLNSFDQNNINDNNYMFCHQSKGNNFDNNCYNFSNQDNSEGTIKEKTNYKLYSSNNCKTEKNSYVSKANIGSDKTTFMQEKTENNYQNNNLVEKTQTKNDKKQNAPNHKVFVSTYTKTINVNPQNPNLNDIQNQKILIATNLEQNNIIPKQYIEQPQTIIQDKKIPNVNQNSNNNQNINQNGNNNNQNEKQINRNINVLYPKEGYGNEENVQRELKKKKKKKIIYIRHKPLVQQHFDVQIIQNQQEEVIPQVSHHSHQFSPNFNQNNYANQGYQMQENIVPPVINRHQNQYVYNSSELVKIYPPKEEPNFNYNYHRPYTPILRNKRIMPIRNYRKEEENNYSFKSPYRPKQTIISLTPMRTINQPNSPFNDNMQMPNDNEMRYNRRERKNREYRALTPPSYGTNYERPNAFENNYNYYNNYDNRRRMNDNCLCPKNYFIESRQELFDDNQEEDNNGDNCPCCMYERRERMMKNMY